MKLVKTQHADFSRDESTFALINTNVTAYKQYKMQRMQRAKLLNQNKEIDVLKNELNELKSIIKQLVKEKNG